jgi:hypothetical protein
MSEHSKSEYNKQFEKLASYILIKYCAYRYKELEHKDRPDLHDTIDNIGVEVTRSGNYEKSKKGIDFEAESLFLEIMNKNREDLSPNQIRKLEKCEAEGYDFDEFEGHGISTSVGDAYWNTNDNILNSIKSKIDKLNNSGHSGYQDFEQYDLFIFSDLLVDIKTTCTIDIKTTEIISVENNIELFKLIDKISELQKDKTRKYSIVYIYNISKLYALDIHNRKYRIFSIKLSSDEIEKISMQN